MSVAEAPASVVSLRQVGRTFDGDPPVEALRSVDLEIRRGEYVSIVGPSGSGKSTLLNVLGLLDRPTHGTYELDGFDVGSLSDAERTAVRGQRIGFVFQAFHLLPHRTVLENVMLSLLYNRTPSADRKERAEQALDRVGLSHRLEFAPTTLSGGERQRVAIARALVMRPAILLGDEPTGNLDSVTTRSILELFDELQAEGLTLILITHDLDVSGRAHRVVTMTDGVLSDPMAAVR
ncbi:MAG TPA: macrolide ABC transporter ATP-binding protein [Acidimicrobiaceae bacterium]|nr:macrolide ABC transporter ATP-binding protein [Acidimicrobiaceae bacterium]